MAWRFVPAPEAGTATRSSATRSGLGADARQRLQRELSVAVAAVTERVEAREAGVAVSFAVRADRLVHALEREIGEGVRPELVRDLLDGPLVGDHLRARRHVDAVVAGMADRRGRDPQVDLLRARLAGQADDLARGVAADDRGRDA